MRDKKKTPRRVKSKTLPETSREVPGSCKAGFTGGQCLGRVSGMSPKGEVRGTLLQKQGNGAQRKEDSVMSYGGF